MSIETEIASLTQSTTDLLETVNIKKVALDNAVDTAEAAATAAEAKTFESVTGMKTSALIKAGDLVKTVDYYSTQRGGGAEYLIKTVAEATADGDVIDNFGNHDIGGGLYVAVLQYNKTLDASWFGFKEDGSDEGGRINAFFVYCNSKLVPSIKLHLSISSSVMVSWDTPSLKVADCNFSVTITEPLDMGMEILNIFKGDIVGPISLTGPGGSSITSRTLLDGIVISGCARTTFTGFNISNVGRDGLLVSSNYLSNTTLTDVGSVKVTGCGSYAGTNWKTNVSSFVNTGTNNSLAQRSILQVDAIPRGLIAQDILLVDDEPHVILGFSDTEITVFPWLPFDFISGELEIVTGSGVHVVGSDVAGININMLDAVRCGRGLLSRGQYGAVAKRIITQFCHIGYQAGNGLTNVHYGEAIDFLYTEANSIDLLQMSTALRQCVVSTLSGTSAAVRYNMTNARRTDNSRYNYLSDKMSITGQSGRPDPLPDGNISQDITLNSYNTSTPLYGISKGVQNIKLTVDESALNTFSGRHISYTSLVNGTSGTRMTSVTFEIDPAQFGDITVNRISGPLVVDLTGLDFGAVQFEIVYDTGRKDWRIAYRGYTYA